MYATIYEHGISKELQDKTLDRPEIKGYHSWLQAIGVQKEPIISVPAGEGSVDVRVVLDDSGLIFPEYSLFPFHYVLEVSFCCDYSFTVFIHDWTDVLDWMKQYLPTLRMMKQESRFVSLTFSDDSLYALDEEGRVWSYYFEGKMWNEIDIVRNPA